MDDRVKVADELEARFSDERHSLANLATFTKAVLPTILAALRLSDTGRSEAEVSVGGMRAADYESIGTTYDGVRVLAPKTKSTNFTTEEIREAVKKALAKDAALHPPTGQGETRT